MVPVHDWAGQLSVYVKPAEGKVRSQDAKQGSPTPARCV